MTEARVRAGLLSQASSARADPAVQGLSGFLVLLLPAPLGGRILSVRRPGSMVCGRLAEVGSVSQPALT